MKKLSTKIILFLVLATLIMPLTMTKAVPTTSQAEEEVLKASYVTRTRAWDPAVKQPSGIINRYYFNCLEPLYDYPHQWAGDPENLTPILATDYEIGYWPETANHTGGVKSMTFTLRENVTFHDGSEWNATVAKWNYDRIVWISGGFGDYGIQPTKDQFWEKASAYDGLFTSEWNLTWAFDKNATYTGFTDGGTTEQTITNNNPDLKGYVPFLNKTEVLSEYEVKLTFNMWNSKPWPNIYYWNHYMISMHTYAANYTLNPIDDGDDLSADSKNPFIGTGSFEFVRHDDIEYSGGEMVKNEDWWNYTNLRAGGWFDVDRVQNYFYESNTQGIEARNLAFFSGDLDFIKDMPNSRVDGDKIDNSPNHMYISRGYQSTIAPGIILNCVNESNYWTNLPSPYYASIGEPKGLPRKIRQALSYSFDYDTYIDIALDGRAIRSGGVISWDNPFYNESIPLPDFNLTKARQIMLEAYPNETANRGLTSVDDDWKSVGEENPIMEFNFHFDPTFEEVLGYMIDATQNIGCNIPVSDPDLVFNHPDGIFTDMLSGNFKFLEAQIYPLGLPIWEAMDTYYLNLYYRSADLASLSAGATRNFPFLTNATINHYLDMIMINNGTTQQKYYDDLAYQLQNIICPMIYVGHKERGYVLYKGYEPKLPEFQGKLKYAFLQTTDWEWQYPTQIPGFPISIMAVVSLIAIIGASYAIKRKETIIK